MLLDDVGLAVLDSFESVGDVDAVADLLGPRLDEIELGRVGEPAGDQIRSVRGADALAEPRRDERPKLDACREARCDRRLVVSGNCLGKPCPDRERHPVSLGRTGALRATEPPQLTACLTSATILASSAVVSCSSAKEVGHMPPSSRLAAALKPKVEYRVLNFDAF